MHEAVAALDGERFDVLVVGAGGAGASAAQHLCASGYKVLLVDKADFGSGTSSRSSRLLWCGIAHLSPDYPLWRYVLHPLDLARRLRMAHLAMRCRAQLVQTTPQRLQARTFFFPIYRGGKFPGWKVDLGYRTLELLGLGRVSLNYRRLPANEAARQHGMVAMLAQRDDLDSVATYTEYQYQWAERICVDTVLDAERMGAHVHHYTRLTRLEHTEGAWSAWLEDSLSPGPTVRVTASVLVNTAGPWVDRVNGLTGRPSRRHVVGVKGVNVLVKLPPACLGQGLETISSLGQPYYVMPWGEHHFLGPTETVFEGDPDDATVLPQEVEHILAEARRLFAGLDLTARDVVHAWCGVRPRTSTDAATPIKTLSLHDLAPEGMPRALALTGMPLMNHRHAGAAIAKRVGRMLRPSGPSQVLSYAAKLFVPRSPSEPLDAAHPAVSIEELRHAARHEHVRTLADLLFRRTDLGWTPSMGLAVSRRAAEAVADILGWDEVRVTAEVAAYRALVVKHFAPASAAQEPPN